MTLHVVRPDLGESLPDTVPGGGLIVLGGPMSAYPPTAAWIDATVGLLRAAVSESVPTLGVCLGAQLLAVAGGGAVGRGAAGPEIGAGEVMLHDAARADPLLVELPERVPVVQWHWDAVSVLPRDATLLASSPRYEVQAFRCGTSAWGLQFHVEAPLPMVAGWARGDAAGIRADGHTPEEVVSGCAAVDAEVAGVGRRIAARFAALVRAR